MTTPDDTQTQHLLTLLRQFTTGLMVTHAQNTPASSPELQARPVSVAQVDDDGSLWLITNNPGSLFDDAPPTGHVLITFQKDNAYISYAGVAITEPHRDRLEALWQPAFAEWIVDGLDDPTLALVHVQPAHAQYWDHTGTNYTTLFQTLASLLAGHGL
ncbi:MAG: pyridoxamine 5'-phosphate oxidase family protein [Vampirovibrionales bacterium]|nr:pyridoxamine 5'-phosphate oxidase family protein [Cyanobacteria bacterium HKST-UBA03]